MSTNDDTLTATFSVVFPMLIGFIMMLAGVGAYHLLFDPSRGHRQGACYPNKTCNKDLICHDEICVTPPVCETTK